MSDQMTTTGHHGTRLAQPPARVSLREIRECTFRALSAAGASHGEAWTAAWMVLDAELQGHGGIEVLLADLELGRWPQAGVNLLESGSSEQAVLRLGTAEGNRLLRHGPLAVSLAVAEPGRGGVLVPGELPRMSCLDAVLLETALGQQHAVAVLRFGPNGGAWRVALGDGSLGSGRLSKRRLGSLERDDIPVDVVPAGGEEGLWVLASVPRSLQEAPELTWVTAQQRADRRMAAARDGCLVDGVAWKCLYAASRRYLVG